MFARIINIYYNQDWYLKISLYSLDLVVIGATGFQTNGRHSVYLLSYGLIKKAAMRQLWPNSRRVLKAQALQYDLTVLQCIS
jgi:hypothetical protein